MEQFIKDFAAYRLDHVMGDWRPYDEILKTALARTCKRWGIEYRDEGQTYYDAVPGRFRKSAWSKGLMIDCIAPQISWRP
ncbi:Dehalogenase [Pseudomonas ficuserectae]|nr:Dehalogenase [Pseudomonas ficuserectae]RMS31786.1 Dehalogenase [Pseudomonas ficuserectae]RMS40727.1 Dehalogenase [Pseudomonas ficuserectae]